MALHAVTILHLSDLHERGLREREAWRRRRVLGEAWLKNLDELQRDCPIDLVCFTGDLADWGKAQEYPPAGELLGEVLSRLHVPRERLFSVPGNHDIDRDRVPEQWATLRKVLPRLDAQAVSRWLAGGAVPPGVNGALLDAVLTRQGAYRDWLHSFGRSELAPDVDQHGRLGYRTTMRLGGRPFDIHILGLDSAWLAGGDDDAGKLLLTEDQVMRLATDAKGERLGGLRLALVHHPLTDLADGSRCRRLLADHADLLLRGHQHEPEPEMWADPDRRLLQLAAGCLYEGHLADRYPNGYQLLRVWVDDAGRPQRYELRFQSFSERGFWHDDSSLYKAAKQGRLTLSTDGRVLTEPRYFQVPLEENQYFTGRAQVLAELRLGLSQRRVVAVTQRQALSGLGGVGKTQIALAYTYRYRMDYDAVFWLDASTEEALTAGFAAQCSTLGLLRTEPGKSLAESALLFKSWLQQHPRWLLVLDNADDPAQLKSLLPRNAQGHILLTSRAQDLQPVGIVRPIEVLSFTNEEAVEFLLARTERRSAPSAERWAAAELAKQLGELPLALEQAAAYIVAQRVPIADYLVGYERYRLKLLERAKPELSDYPLSVVTTWQVNFDQLQENRPAVAALRLCALLGSAQIPLELLCKVGAEFDPRLGRALKGAEEDSVRLDDLLRPLLRYSLLYREVGSRSVAMHRLVQEVVLDDIPQEDRSEYARRLVNALSMEFPLPEESSNWPMCERWLPHALAALSHCDRFKIEGDRAARLHNQVALYLDGRMQQSLAEPLFKRAIEMRRRIELSSQASLENIVNLAVVLCNLAALNIELGDMKAAELRIHEAEQVIVKRDGAQSPYLTVVLLRKAQMLRHCGRHVESTEACEQAFERARHSSNVFLQYGALLAVEQAESLSARGLDKEAEDAYERALAVSDVLYGRDSDIYARLQMHQSTLLRKRGQIHDAEKAARAAFEQAKQNFGETHPQFADAAQTLGLALAERGRFEEALSLFQSVTKLRRELFGGEHPLYAEALRNEATSYRSLADYVRAAQLAEQAVQIRETADANSKSFHEELNELGLIYLAQGRPQDAEKTFLRSLKMIEQTVGPEHPDAATAHNNLALVYEARAEYEAAEREYRLAAEVSRRCLGETHPDYFLKLHNIAHVNVFLGRYDEALTIYEQVLSGWKKSYGEEHDKITICLNGMTAAALAAGNDTLGERYAKESVRIAEKIFAPRHPGLARSLAALAQCYQARLLHEKAVSIYEKALSILTESGQEESLQASVMSSLGGCLVLLDRSVEAAALLRSALAIKEKLLGQRHPELVPTLSELGCCLLRQDDLAGAEAHLERAIELCPTVAGKKSPRCATLLSNLAFVRRRQGRMDEAIELEKSVVALREQNLGVAHPEVAMSYAHLAEMQASHGHHEGAQQSLAQASQSSAAQAVEAPHLRFVQLMQQGKTLQQLGKYDSALQTLLQAALEAIAAFGHRSVEHLRALLDVIGVSVQAGQLGTAGTKVDLADQLIAQFPNVPGDQKCMYHLAKGMYFRTRGRLDDAKVELDAVLSAVASLKDKEISICIQAHNLLAGIAEMRNDRRQAAEHYTSSLTLLSQMPPSRDRDDAELLTLINRSQTLAATGRLSEATEAIVRAESITDRNYPRAHPTKIALLQRRSLIARKSAGWQAALPFLEQAEQLADAIWPEDYPARGELLRSMGEACGHLGQAEKAIGSLKRAIRIHELAEGLTSSAVRQDLIELAQIERRIGDATQAVVHAKRALSISRAATSPDARDVTADTLLLGLAYQAAGDLQAAIEVTQATLADAEPPRSQLTLRPEERVMLLHGLGGFQKQHRDVDGALASFTKIRDHFQKFPPQKDADRDTLASVLHGSADCMLLQEASDLVSAKQLYEKSLTVRCATKSPSPVELAKTLSNLAVVALQEGVPEQAESRAREAFGLAVKSQDGGTLVMMGQGLARVLVRCGKPDEAVELLSQLQQSVHAAVGPEHELALELEEELQDLLQHVNSAVQSTPVPEIAAPSPASDTRGDK